MRVDGTRTLERIRRVALAVGLLGSILLATPPTARAGDVTGTLRGLGGSPLPDRLVSLIGTSGGQSATSDVNGHYTFSGVTAGNYFVKVNIMSTWPAGVPDPNGLVGELYSKIPCPMNGCTETEGTEIAVPASGTVTIDFDFKPGVKIQGTITAAGSGTPLAGISVYAFDLKNRLVASTSTDGAGHYTVQGIPAGTYFLQTYSAGSRADQLYNGAVCGSNQCVATSGTPVTVGPGATVSGIDFVLAAAAHITGTVTDGGSNPVANAVIEVWNGSGRLGYDFATDALGAYQVDGLPAGTTLRVLARKAGLVTAVYNFGGAAAPCPNVTCDMTSTGSGVTTTAGGTTANINVQLFPGHSIGGANPSNATVKVFGSTGLVGTSNNNGWSVGDLPDGSYSVRAVRRRQIAEWWNDRQCPGDFNCVKDTVTVSGANVTGIDMVLANGASILGTLTESSNGDPVAFLDLASYHKGSGTFMTKATSNRDGTYEADEGFSSGIYVIRTSSPATYADFRDEMWNDHSCSPFCSPSSGDSISLSGTGLATGIDFSLARNGISFFTLPPCRLFDSRTTGPALAAATDIPLRLEAACGVPGHAIAVSANVTVVSPTADGSVNVWPFNLVATPGTSVISFRSGQTRANNALLGLSRYGLSNVKLRGTLTGGGTYHLILDVNGYFAPDVTP